ncbi:hypothetical protein [Streptomyces sp. CA-132043]|uniref:hypothetical protein n=1 Tax=Streptomyces sp. CA-132043 TaxID=3240048 RepID=UPI003D8B787E
MHTFLFGTRSRRQQTLLAAAGVLGLTGALAFTGPADASADNGPTGTAQSSGECGNATLKGHYIYHLSGFEVSGGKAKPQSEAGAEWYDGKGHIKTLSSGSDNGKISTDDSGTGTYDINADCSGTATYRSAGETTHYRLYVSRDGDTFRFVGTDQGTVVAGEQERA